LAIRILLVDDHPVVRMGLSTAIRQYMDCEVVGEAANGKEAIGMVESLRPDVVVLDIRLPDQSGIEVCREIRDLCPSTQVVMLTAYAEDELILGAVIAGASGYVLKHYGVETLVTAIQAAARGEAILDPGITSRLLQRMRSMATGGFLVEGLTPQEEKVLNSLAQGLTNKEIAEQLFISVRTAKNHVSSILAKLGLRNRSEVAAFATRTRWPGGNSR